MILDRSSGVQQMVLIMQCVIVVILFWLWVALCCPHPIRWEMASRYFIYNDFVLLGLILGSRPFRGEAGLHRPNFEETTRRSFRQLRYILLYLLLALFAAGDIAISRVFLFSFFPLLYVALIATNRLLPENLGRLTFGRNLRQKVILVGPKANALEVKRWLDQSDHLGFELLGLLSNDSEESNDQSLPILGKSSDLERLLSAPGLTTVIVVEFPREDTSMAEYTSLCEERGARLLVVADLDRLFGHPLTVFEDRRMSFFGLREEPLQDPVNRFFKRALDIVVSLPVVIFVLPPLALAARVCQRFQSPGPLLFPQLREGIHNHPFTILKLRTMHVGNPANEKLPSSKDDPRLYPVGSLLRRSSLDEMVQFWNVLRGDMSVVGPRPHLSSYNKQYREVFQRAYVRSYIKPGITGLAQVRGYRGTAETSHDVVRRMESDIEYLENWSFWLDCWLILRTVLLVFFPPKAAV